MGDPLFNKINVVMLEWILHWKEVKQSLDGCPFVSLFQTIWGKIFENVENLEQTFKSLFMQVFWNVLDIV